MFLNLRSIINERRIIESWKTCSNREGIRIREHGKKSLIINRNG